MDALKFASLLVAEGYRKIDTGVLGLNAYTIYTQGRNHIVGIFNCKKGCLFDGWQLVGIEQDLGIRYGTDEILFVAFSDDAYQTRCALSDDHRHWIYNESMQRVEIFDDQPGEFLNVRQLLEYRKEPVSNIFLSVNNLIILINVIVYIVLATKGDMGNGIYLYSKGAVNPYSLVNNHEYYRLFTSMFLHAGIRHLISNMFVLYFLGESLESVVGHVKYLIIYLGSGLIGGIISQSYYYSIGKMLTPCVGASGAIFGVLGAILWILIISKGRNNKFTLARVIIYILFSIYIGFTSEGISLSAHIGGLIGGFVLAMLLYRKRGIYT